MAQIFEVKKFIRILCLLAIAFIVSLLITMISLYFLFVADIYINTEKLSRVNAPLNAYCEDIVRNPKFTKGSVTFRVDKGTLVFRLNAYISTLGLYGYAPFFIFPHNKTIVLAEQTLKFDSLAFATLVAHELGHIQGGLKHFGTAKKMENYANEFAAEIVKTQLLKKNPS